MSLITAGSLLTKVKQGVIHVFENVNYVFLSSECSVLKPLKAHQLIGYQDGSAYTWGRVLFKNNNNKAITW